MEERGALRCSAVTVSITPKSTHTYTHMTYITLIGNPTTMALQGRERESGTSTSDEPLGSTRGLTALSLNWW